MLKDLPASENILIIFIKYPEPGFVKTRLAKDIGSKKALDFYRVFVEIIVENTKANAYQQIIFYSPGEKEKQITQWLGDGNVYCSQKGSNLGEKLSRAFSDLFSQGAKRVIVIGSDSPLIDAKLINESFAKLNDEDCVIGPCRDGGYYLLGLSKPCDEIFEDIAWSSDKVFEQTLSKIQQSNLSFSKLETHFDVDREADLIELRDKILKISSPDQGYLLKLLPLFKQIPGSTD